ncbi:hypothetical protein ABTX24_19550 [Nocardioides sp. NPDC127514]
MSLARDALRRSAQTVSELAFATGQESVATRSPSVSPEAVGGGPS